MAEIFDKKLPDDRRSSKRYDLPVKINYHDPITKLQRETLTSNISRNGFRFSLTAEVPRGTILDLEIEDPYGRAPVLSKAKVMWTKKFITGDDAEDIIYEAGAKLIRKTLY